MQKLLIGLILVLTLCCGYLLYKLNQKTESLLQLAEVTEMVIYQCLAIEKENKKLKNDRNTY